MKGRLFKIVMGVVIVASLISTHFLQKTINRERGEMGLTRLEVLEKALADTGFFDGGPWRIPRAHRQRSLERV
jgi:hypothetical protein